jgi:hypothetical protein
MKEHDRLTATGLVVLMLILWLGFLVHRSPRFAGSFWGGVLGISGAALMLVPLAYMVVKRIGPLKRLVTRGVAMRTLLTWHIYAGILGPILALLHTGHKFVSPLGIALTAMMLVVVLSGFVGRYLLSQFSEQVREKREMLTRLEVAYQQTSGELAAQPEQIAMLSPVAGLLSRVGAWLLWADKDVAELPVSARALRITESMADLEYAIQTHQKFKQWFGHWLRFHIVISFILYALLALHVYFAVYFGLRWFA